MRGYRSRAPTLSGEDGADFVRGELPALSLVIGMAMSVAKTLGVGIPNPRYLRRAISKRLPIPQVYKNEHFILWIDRFYIAVQSLAADDAPVGYIYLTRAHIAEELASDSRARERGREGCLDAPTRAQFAAACRAMEGSRLGYATRELRPTSSQQQPLDLKASWRCGYPPDEENAPAKRRERR